MGFTYSLNNVRQVYNFIMLLSIWITVAPAPFSFPVDLYCTNFTVLITTPLTITLDTYYSKVLSALLFFKNILAIFCPLFFFV